MVSQLVIKFQVLYEERCFVVVGFKVLWGFLFFVCFVFVGFGGVGVLEVQIYSEICLKEGKWISKG